ncbi:hypothetical protein CVT26_015985 [Gymnopilus dilepis]|uniref:PPM-type phosphatase domain-containing protein n=1 Tax=Gymnopilus dilepis TaxID=231916 RepID=A0A409WXE4_9AGAR|nr:hypothetical protein CVT26_015985 [Gymnopilus dilepis]
MGVRRRDMFRVGSNAPPEDAISASDLALSPTLTLSTTAIFDGHNGPRLAEFLAVGLPVVVRSLVQDVFEVGTHADIARRLRLGDLPDPTPPDEEVDAAIKQAFRGLDEVIVHESARLVLGLMLTRAEALEELYGAYAGSCAVMTLFNPKDRTLRVALTGDSRAVYGRRVPAPPAPSSSQTSSSQTSQTTTSKPTSTPSSTSPQPQTPAYTHIYRAERLTADQTPSNPTEVALISSQHPSEPPSALFKNGRFLGWGPTRAFGDGSMKWPVPIQRALYNLGFFGDRVREDEVKTPPYMTAEPVVTRREGVEKGDFVVLGSDGLWECLTDEEVVGLVGVWLEERGVKERFVLDPGDANVAAHVVRNALGGADADLREALCALEGGRGRRFRDDISVVVVFFD